MLKGPLAPNGGPRFGNYYPHEQAEVIEFAEYSDFEPTGVDVARPGKCWRVRRCEPAHHRSFLKDPFTRGRRGPAHNTHMRAHTPWTLRVADRDAAGPRRAKVRS